MSINIVNKTRELCHVADPIDFKTHDPNEHYQKDYYHTNKFKYVCKICNKKLSLLKPHYESKLCEQTKLLRNLEYGKAIGNKTFL